MASKVFLGVTIKPADEKRMVGDIRNFYGAGLVFTSYSTAKNSVTWPHRDAQEMENYSFWPRQHVSGEQESLVDIQRSLPPNPLSVAGFQP